MRVVVVSTHRSDKAHYAPLLRCLRATPGLDVTLYAKNRAYEDYADEAVTIGNIFSKTRRAAPDVQYDAGVVLGDRYEMLLAAAQLVEARIPLLHIHGGEHTYGSLDERWRWAMSSIADEHCTATDKAAWELANYVGVKTGPIHITGAPGLDDIQERQPFPNAPKIVVLYNPAIDEETTKREGHAIAEAITGMVTWWVAPNGDRFSDLIAPNVDCVSLDSERFRDLLAAAHVIVGNSSAGIIEAPSLGTWTVNVGERQAGRPRAASVLDVAADPVKIRAFINSALVTDCPKSPNPYGDGHASERIRDVLLGMMAT